MIKIENVVTPSPEQWKATIMGTRNAMNSWEKSDSYFDGKYCDICEHKDSYCDPKHPCFNAMLGKNDRNLMMKLRNSGTDHRKFMRMITVYVDITAPLYW